MDITGILNSNRRAVDSQSAANWFNDIGAFQRQQAQDESFRGRDLQIAQNIAQMREAQANRQIALDQDAQRRAEDAQRYNLEFLTRQDQAAQARDQAAKDFDLRSSYFDLDKAKQDAALADKADAVQNIGSTLVGAYQKAFEDAKQTEQALNELRNKQAEIAQIGEGFGASYRNGMLTQNNSHPIVDNNGAWVVPRLNKHLTELNNLFLQAKQVHDEKNRALRNILQDARKSGFEPSDTGFIHARTGRRFDFGMPDIGGDTGNFWNGVSPDQAQEPVQVAAAPSYLAGTTPVRLDSVTNQGTRGFPEQSPAVNYPTPQSRAEYEALPPGTVFINAADGALRRKL